MSVDVEVSIEINRHRDEVAAFACDPDNVTAWYANIHSVDWVTPRPLSVGSQLEFVASFLGRRLTYTYQVRTHEPGSLFVMSTADGPFPMETTYTWVDAEHGATHMALRNRGEPAGFAGVAAPLMARGIRRATTKDLERLKRLLEA